MKMLRTDKAVSAEIEKTAPLVIGDDENTSLNSKNIDPPDTIPTKVIKNMPIRVLSAVSITSFAGILGLNSLSLMKNWHQPEIIVILAIPMVIQCAVSIILVGWFLLGERLLCGFFKLPFIL